MKACRIVFQPHLTRAHLITLDEMGTCTGDQKPLCYTTVAHLSSYEGGSDVQAGILGEGNPVLIDLHQLLDALQQFTFIKQLQRKKRQRVNSQIIALFHQINIHTHQRLI